MPPAFNTNDIVDACSSCIRDHGDGEPVPPLLYHFTDAAGFVGIVSKKCLWASLATTLNDCLEVQHGLNIVTTELSSRESSANVKFASSLRKYLADPLESHMQAKVEAFPFVVSFCGSVDRSGMWLHYGRGGKGLAVAFTPEIHKVVSYDLVQVDYCDKSQKRRVRTLLDVGSSMLSRTKNSAEVELTAHIVAMYARQLAVRMKHGSFSDEREWRLIAQCMYVDRKNIEPVESRRGLKYRTSMDQAIPYEELSFAEQAAEMIQEIVLGYSCSTSPEAMRILLLENGLKPIIRRSEVPVR